MPKDMNFIGRKSKPSMYYGHANMIYIVGVDPEGPVKIGQSADVAKRLSTIQVGNPLPLSAFGLRLVLPKIIPGGRDFDIIKAAKAGASSLENYVHFELQKMGLRLVGEWFDISAREALQVVEKSAINLSLRAVGPEWLSSNEARVDPEIGWMRDRIAPMAIEAQAQAGAATRRALTRIK